jgi:hypothetical protein
MENLKVGKGAVVVVPPYPVFPDHGNRVGLGFSPAGRLGRRGWLAGPSGPILFPRVKTFEPRTIGQADAWGIKSLHLVAERLSRLGKRQPTG